MVPKYRAWDKIAKKMYQLEGIDLTESVGYGYITAWDRYGQIYSSIDKDSSVLMQWTGLKDKNGKEIYEGDIIQDRQQWWRGEVFWRQELPGFYLRKVADDRYTGNMEWIDLMSGGNVEIYNVIGNIYENPDLL